MTQLHWIKCNNGESWCPLSDVDLSGVDTFGVYIIWKPGNPSIAIRVGQGHITDRITAHRQDPEITAYGDDLLVTWADAPWDEVDGIEQYLAQQYFPAVGERFPDTPAIAVNLPT